MNEAFYWTPHELHDYCEYIMIKLNNYGTHSPPGRLTNGKKCTAIKNNPQIVITAQILEPNNVTAWQNIQHHSA